MTRRLPVLAMLIAALALLVGCGGGQLTAADILTQSADAMAGIDSVQFAIERQGEGLSISLTPTMNVLLLGATGGYQAPDSATAAVRVNAAGMVAEAEMLWQGGETFYKLPPLVAAFTPVELTGFSISDIFNAEVGIPAILRALENPTLVGEEDVDGVTAYHITAATDGEMISGLVGGAVQPGPATLDLWIAKDTMYVIRITIAEEGENGWLVDFFGYNEPVEIPTP